MAVGQVGLVGLFKQELSNCTRRRHERQGWIFGPICRSEVERSITFQGLLEFTTIDTDRCVPHRTGARANCLARRHNRGRGTVVSGKIDVENRLVEEAIVKKVFHFEAPRENYHCDAAILWCFDHRFDLGFRKFLKRIGVANSDPIKVAGGAKCLASPEHEREREFVLEQIRKSMRLHGTSRVILMVHSDCGAYGGLAGGFGGDAQAEAAHHQRELARAAAHLLETIPGIEVQGYFVDFEGIWDAEVATVQPQEQEPVA